MGSIYEEHGTFAFFGLRQKRFKFLFQVFSLFFGVSFGWQHTYLTTTHSQFGHKMPHLSFTALDPRQSLNLCLSFLDRCNWMVSEMFFECIRMSLQLTFRTITFQHFQTFNAPGLIERISFSAIRISEVNISLVVILLSYQKSGDFFNPKTHFMPVGSITILEMDDAK